MIFLRNFILAKWFELFRAPFLQNKHADNTANAFICYGRVSSVRRRSFNLESNFALFSKGVFCPPPGVYHWVAPFLTFINHTSVFLPSSFPNEDYTDFINVHTLADRVNIHRYTCGCNHVILCHNTCSSIPWKNSNKRKLKFAQTDSGHSSISHALGDFQLRNDIMTSFNYQNYVIWYSICYVIRCKT